MALVFLISFLSSVILTPVAMAAGRRAGIIDMPRRGEVQLKPVARTGGYAMFVAFVLGIGASIFLLPHFPEEYPRVLALVLGAVVILPVALIDDLRRLGPKPQMAAQVAIALIPLSFGMIIDNVASPLGGLIWIPDVVAFPLTLFWVVGMVNTMNFTDTMDGLAGGIGLIAALVLFLVSFILGQDSIAALPLALAGACAGFLIFNFHPAKVFMGTSGSMLIGYALAVLAIIGGAKIATTAMVLGIPIIDVGLVIITRSLSGRSPFAGGDSAHLPHRLLKAGFSQRTVALALYTLCLAFGMAALPLVRIQKLYALAVMVVVLALVFAALAIKTRTSKASASVEPSTSPEPNPKNS